jgi:hypothetical protein
MRLSTRMRAVVALQSVFVIAVVLVHVIPSFALVLYLIAIMVVIASGSLAIAEYLSQRL